MKILLVTETYLPYISGVASSTDSIARYMASKGHKVVIANPNPVTKGNVELPKNVRLAFVPSIPDLLYKGKAMAIFPLTFFNLNKAFRENKFDVVHIQEPGGLGLTALILAKIYKIPTVGALHFIPEQIDRVFSGSLETIFAPTINSYVRTIYNQYDQIMAPSHHFANFLKNLGVTKPINVISNGVNTKIYHPSDKNITLRKKYNIPLDSTVFFFLGRLDGDKNVGTLVRAMPYVKDNVHLLVVGKGKDKNSLHLLAKKLKVEAKITWIDYITDDEMVDIYHAADAFSIMSPFEGQSIVTLQAVASGLPLICARAGALPELCLDGKNAYLVDTYDFKTLAVRMNELAKDTKLRDRFGKISREISLTHEKTKVLHQLEVLYEKISR